MNRRYTKKRRSLKKRSLTKKKRKNTFRKQRGGGGTTRRKAAEAKALAEELYRQEKLDRQVEAAAELQRKTVSGVLTALKIEEELREKRARLAEGDALSEGIDQKVRKAIKDAINDNMSSTREQKIEIIKKILMDNYPEMEDDKLVEKSNRMLSLLERVKTLDKKN